MGLTPTEGLIMGTRSGDVDPGALPYIMEKEGLDAQGLSDLLNKEIWRCWFSEISSDMRDIEDAEAQGNRTCDSYDEDVRSPYQEICGCLSRFA